MPVIARLAWIHDELTSGRSAHISIGPARDDGKIKYKITFFSSFNLHPAVRDSLLAVVMNIQQLILQNYIVVDRGHKHSNGVSEIGSWAHPALLRAQAVPFVPESSSLVSTIISPEVVPITNLVTNTEGHSRSQKSVSFDFSNLQGDWQTLPKTQNESSDPDRDPDATVPDPPWENDAPWEDPDFMRQSSFSSEDSSPPYPADWEDPHEGSDPAVYSSDDEPEPPLPQEFDEWHDELLLREAAINNLLHDTIRNVPFRRYKFRHPPPAGVDLSRFRYDNAFIYHRLRRIGRILPERHKQIEETIIRSYLDRYSVDCHPLQGFADGHPNIIDNHILFLELYPRDKVTIGDEISACYREATRLAILQKDPHLSSDDEASESSQVESRKKKKKKNKASSSHRMES